MSEPPEQTADRLFLLPPRRFVAERDLAAAEARAAGDTGAARALAALRRPTVAAWLVNLLALRRPELLAQLAELAAALQSAQRSLQGEQLRELARQRRAVIEALVGTSRQLAREADPEVASGKLPLAEVEATLAAALGDPELAARVQAGRLQRTVDAGAGGLPAGFGGPAGAHLRLVPGGVSGDDHPQTTGAQPADPQSAELAAARAAARAEHDEARAAVAAAEQAQQEAAGSARAAAAELAELDDQLARLQERRAEAARRAASAEAADLTARRQVAAARRRLGQAEAELAALEAEPS